MIKKPTYEELEKRVNALQIENDEIRKAKQAIENSEDLHRIILENFSDTAIITDYDGKIIYTCPNKNMDFNLSHEQVYDKGTIQKIINETACYLSKLRKIKEIRNIERSILDRSGRRRFVLISLKSVSIKGGSVLYVIRDITDSKQMEQERLADFKFFENMDKVNRTIQGTTDLEQLMMDVLDIVLSIFDCDRASLVYPCDPKAPSWIAPMERAKPEWPGALTLGLETPMDPEAARIFRATRAADGPVEFGPGYKEQVPTGIAEQFNIQSQITMALYPRTGQPWNFVLHQCSYPRVWTQGEKKLLTGIGRRLEGALTTLLVHRTLQDSEQRLRKIIENTGAGYFFIDLDGNLQNVNASWLKMHGYISDDDIIGRHFSVTQTETHLQHAKKIVERVLSGKTTTVDEFSRLNKDGSIGYHSFFANPVIKGDKIIGLEGFIIDISERKMAELALIDSEQEMAQHSDQHPSNRYFIGPYGKN